MTITVRVSTRDLTKTLEISEDEAEVAMRFVKPCNFTATYEDNRSGYTQMLFADRVKAPRRLAEFLYQKGIAVFAE